MSFRTRNDSIASTLMLLGLLIALGTAIWLTMPLPAPLSQDAFNRQIAQMNKDMEKAQAERVKAEDATAPLIWTDSLEKVGPKAMATATALARAHGLKVSAFRPQKPVESIGLTQLPFTITLDGPFLSTMEFVKDLEKATKTPLAVSNVQVASADAATDRVSGTVSMVAFVRPSTEVKTQGGNDAKRS